MMLSASLWTLVADAIRATLPSERLVHAALGGYYGALIRVQARQYRAEPPHCCGAVGKVGRERDSSSCHQSVFDRNVKVARAGSNQSVLVA